MTRIMIKLFAVGLQLLATLSFAEPGRLFNISETGSPSAVDIILCLNAKGPISCQQYRVNARDLQIITNKGQYYPAAGIKVLTPGYQPTGCIPHTNGYCLFTLSNSAVSKIHLGSNSEAIQAGLSVSASSNAIVYNATTSLSATGGTGTGLVSYAVINGADYCSISGSTLTGTGIGACQVIATKAGDADYRPISSSAITVTVTTAAQAVLTLSANPDSIPYNGTLTLSTMGGSGTGAVSYAVTAGASNCSISGNILTGTNVGTCEVTA
ncbi:MAG: hypothetical protein LCH30_09880, partial [Proteobacteria bacterium]|nr:hypothetical protein [Pseudomonadota bacterium]